ncbi:MAG: hypothetical protein RLZZ232_1919 [Planctomycetota bacterium]
MPQDESGATATATSTLPQKSQAARSGGRPRWSSSPVVR